MTCGRGHAILKRFDELHVRHLCFFIACVSHRLLSLKARALVCRVIELAVPLSHFGTSDDEMKSFYKVWIVRF